MSMKKSIIKPQFPKGLPLSSDQQINSSIFFIPFRIQVYDYGEKHMVSLNPGQFNSTTIRNRLWTLLPSYTDHQDSVPERKTNRKLQTWTLINWNCYLINILQIVFLESMFLVLIDEEKVGEKRSPAKKIVLICQRIQAINLKKKKKPSFNKENEKCN